jgi:hypothetical protein
LYVLPLVLVLAAPATPTRLPGRPAAAAVSPSVELGRGRTAFERGEYARAIEILRPLLYPESRLESEGEIASVHRMLGVAHLYARQDAEAAAEFRKLLQLRPDYRMDRLLDPPMVVDFFNSVLKEQEAELTELERKRRRALEDERRRQEALRTGPVVIEKHYGRNSFAVNFIPFGAGQFQNGQPAKGWLFLGTEALLGAVSAGAMATNFALYGARPPLRCEEAPESPGGVCPTGFKEGPERGRSRLLMKVQLVSGALFFATAIWGVTDAVLNYRPEVAITPALSLVGDGTGGSLTFRF